MTAQAKLVSNNDGPAVRLYTSPREFREEAGLDLPYGCREGICHTCVGELRSGRVRDLRNGKVYGQEGEVIRPVRVDADRRGYVIATGPTSVLALEAAESAARLIAVDVDADGDARVG